ncbi:unnamed protein product [Acanthoscelides obtectus]|uniref:Uncharacterized protein n=1 Tax=Acanthoscelides obtectus TaxID=200917 RepID=A0A9P0PKH9_ACAOB|nr:unnamed protein product [Acanthoscelides obtectus]CAK1639355.1 hypothetical protein AOBTE_LOCUS11141 [Acanthoscelides obtectus]
MLLDTFKDTNCLNDNNLTVARIKKCARYHQLIIDYTSDVFECFTTLLIVHVSLASIVLAFLSFQIVHANETSEKIRHLVHLGGWMALLFATCYYGQQIIEKVRRKTYNMLVDVS